MKQNKILAVDGRFLKLERLGLLNYFLFQEAIPKKEREELAKEFLSMMLDEEIAKVKITPQKSILADGSECQSVRLDVYMEDVSMEDVSMKSEEDSTGKDNSKNDSKNANEGGSKDDDEDDQEDDYDEGYDDGFDDGQDMVNLLNLKLVMAGRLADMIRAAGNKEYQEKLFEEFDL